MTLHIAIPKGRLGKEIIQALQKTDYYGIVEEDSRQLVFHSREKDLTFSMVKNSDVTTYVQEKVFDIGFTGLDMILERKPKVYLLERYPIGICKMCVAELKDRDKNDGERTKRVATSFPNITKKYYGEKGIDVRAMELAGSVELAPILGLSDAIVDIVETGNTLRENGLIVVDEIIDIYCCLIANEISYKFKEEELETFMRKIQEGLGQWNVN